MTTDNPVSAQLWEPNKPPEVNAEDNRFWLGWWSVLTVLAIVLINAVVLIFTDALPDGFRELSTLAITGVLAAAAGGNKPKA